MRLFAAVCLLVLMTPAWAARGYTLDPEASRVRFQLHALGWWPVRGEARAEGTVASLDERLRIDVRVPLATLTMAREGYRDWALSPEFFWAARHPELRFLADASALADWRAGGEIRGELQVRGRRRAVRFVLTGSDCSDTAATCRVQASGELSRRAFGMRSRRLTLGDRIRIELDLRLVATP
jgi:polyisoprenoid-binding protein YceI